ncbi:MAG TPA: hypothetical protein VK815_16655 [Candidatus Acidoferrales bacterium]|jgi:hypothetical protein|nr:hypothetical protein [Candidatus Acidoferrales bacterium]
MQLTLDPGTKAQIMHGASALKNPNLIYVHVAIAEAGDGKDQFFVLTQAQLQQIATKCYSAWMETIGWKRPQNPESYDCRYEIKDLEPYRDNWHIITDQLRPSNVAESSEAA